VIVHESQATRVIVHESPEIYKKIELPSFNFSSGGIKPSFAEITIEYTPPPLFKIDDQSSVNEVVESLRESVVSTNQKLMAGMLNTSLSSFTRRTRESRKNVKPDRGPTTNVAAQEEQKKANVSPLRASVHKALNSKGEKPRTITGITAVTRGTKPFITNVASQRAKLMNTGVVARATNISNKQCEHCQRKFNDKAYSRHVEYCSKKAEEKAREERFRSKGRNGNLSRAGSCTSFNSSISVGATSTRSRQGSVSSSGNINSKRYDAKASLIKQQ
jgi:hypothetical protein